VATHSTPDSRGRGWTIILVPPHPTGKTRSVRVHMRQVRTLVATAMLAFVGYAGWSMIEALQVNATAEQLAQVQRLAVTLSDSLQASQSRADSALRLAAVTANVAHGPKLVTRLVNRVGRANTASVGEPAAGVILPVIGRITSKFAESRWHPILNLFRPHEGVDISAPRGTNITAPADGRVTFVGHRLGDGLLVELDHGGGVITLYAHCQRVLVGEGEYVAAGAVIATVGSSGLATGPHVHFEVMVNGRHVDPLKYLLEPRDSTPAFAAGDHPDEQQPR